MKIGGMDVLTLTEAADRLGVATSTLRHQIARGSLVAIRLGGRYVVEVGEVERYQEERKGKHGFAAESHPMHGKQGPGHRRKKTEE